MRFAVAKQQGLDETMVAQIDDAHAESDLAPRLKLALAFADAFIGAAGPPKAAKRAAQQAEFGDDEKEELAVGHSSIQGVSKLLITLGCEPEQMELTELPTPGS